MFKILSTTDYSELKAVSGGGQTEEKSGAYPTIPIVTPGTQEADDKFKKFITDLGQRKEFYSLRYRNPAPQQVQNVFGFKQFRNTDKLSLPGMRIKGEQLFVSNFFNPNTEFKRILINWQTGTGKTICVLTVTQEYIRSFIQHYQIEPSKRPSVFIFGFTRNIIMQDMLKYPELGFVSYDELEEIKRMTLLADAAGSASMEARLLSSFKGVLKRRITDRTRGGYYIFYGYKEFANRLFTPTRKGTEQEFDVQAIYEQSVRSGKTFTDMISHHVKIGNIAVNEDLLESLKGSLVVCDEIHNVYNMQSKNNYGIAIQYILDILKDDAPRAVFMSATPMTGSAAEIVDLLNLLVPLDLLPGGVPLRRKDFFSISRDELISTNEDDAEVEYRSASQLLPGALEKIGQLSAGRVSFLLDTDLSSYPKKLFEGEHLANIPYLYFTPCPMSPFHEKTLKAAMAKGGTGLQANSQSLYDIAFPNPDAGSDTGLYESGETIAKFLTAPTEWKDAVGVTVLKGAEAGVSQSTNVISGDFLSLSDSKTKPGIQYYSTKYATLITKLLELVKSGPGKIRVHHHRVRMSGILLIQELLRMNGFTDEVSGPTGKVICSVCGIPRDHHENKAHEYQPARFVVAHSDIDRSVMEKSIAKFNDSSNLEGYKYRVLLGSKIVREGYTFKAVRWSFIISLTVDIATYQQILGRDARNGTHLELPEDQRNVTYFTLVSTTSDGGGPELHRYSEKMKEYLVIQEVDKTIRKFAVDGFANYGRLAGIIDRPTLDSLPYVPLVRAEDLTAPLALATFDAYGHSEKEVKIITSILEVLFQARNVWKYDDLWRTVKEDKVRGVFYDCALFEQGNFDLALAEINKPRGNPPYMVVHAEPFYVKCAVNANGKPDMDIEAYLRASKTSTETDISRQNKIKISKAIQHLQGNKRFDVGLAYFTKRYFVERVLLDLSLVEVDGSFHMALMRKLVEESFRVGLEKINVTGNHDNDMLLIGLYRRFRLLYIVSDLQTSQAIHNYKGKLTGVNPELPVGYLHRKFVNVFLADTKWQEMSLSAFGIGRRTQENGISIGFVSDESEEEKAMTTDIHTKFKIRPPLQTIAISKGKDIRSLDRGAVCITRPRHELNNIVGKLKEAAKKNLAFAARAEKILSQRFPSASELCTSIKTLLLGLEEMSRNESMADGMRWVYLYHDKVPDVASAIKTR